MELSGNTILLTGGTSGIGLELARRLMALDVLVVTDEADPGLDAAKEKRPSVHPLLRLRLQLKHTNITVFELAPPITETSLSQGDMSMSHLGSTRSPV